MPAAEGEARWNPRSQRWETPAADSGPPGGAPPGPDTPPGVPPRPARPPEPWNPWAAPGPPGPPPAPRRRTLLAASAGAAVAVAVAAAAWLLLGDGRPSGPAPAPSGTAVPSGYTRVEDTTAAFSVAVPSGWQVSPDDAAYGTVYRPVGGDRISALQVFRDTRDTEDACVVLRSATEEISKRNGYRELSRGPVAGGGCEQAYTYDDPASSDPVSIAVGRLTVAADHTRWVIMAYGRDSDSDLVRAQARTAVESFRRT